jgi:hypothetical protein
MHCDREEPTIEEVILTGDGRNGIVRTLPIDSAVGYARIARIHAKGVSTDKLTQEFLDRLRYVLGRDYK